MGGGDGGNTYWPHSQTSSQPQSSQSSRKGADLAELNQLRVLVQYEFEKQPISTDELIEALGTCHNNIREAYHYLKAKRLQQERSQSKSSSSATNALPPMTTDSAMARSSQNNHDAGTTASTKRHQPDDEDVFIIENPSKKLKEGTSPPSSQRSLRLKSSQDVAMSSSSPPSSRQSNGGALAPSSIQYVDDEEDVSIVFSQRNVPPPSSQEAASDSVAANPLQARRLLDQAIEDRCQNRIATDASWISSVWDFLHVSSNLELSQRLDLTCDAMVAWLKEFDERDVLAQKRAGIDLILEIVSHLPRSDNAHELSQQSSLTHDDRRAQDAEVTALHDLLTSSSAQSANARSVAANDAIVRITEECAFYLERIEWFKNARRDNVEHQNGVRCHIQTLFARLSEMVDKCSAEVHSGDSVVADARQTKEMRSIQLREFVQKRREELRATGESDVSAELQAHSDVFNSNELEIVALLQSRAESGTKIQQCSQKMQKGKKELVFYQSAKSLFSKVKERRDWSLQNALKSFEDSHRASDQRATRALTRYIPMLTNALQEYYEFHSVRQKRAKEEASEQEQKLEEHVEYFGDSAPIKKDDIEKRIREFVGVISRSMQLMLQIADSQSRLWEGKQDILPREVCDILVLEYGKLWQQLSGPVRDVMQSFVAKMQGGSVDVSTDVRVEPPAVTAGSTNGSPQRSISSSPEKVGGTRRSLSPGAFVPNGVVTNVTAMRATVIQPSASLSMAQALLLESSAPLSMTQEVDAFLERIDVDPTSTTITSVREEEKVMSPPKASPTPPVHASETSVVPHEFEVGAILFTKFDVGDNRAQFFRGRVDKLVEDGSYSMVYDDGDIYTVPRAFLFTQEQMEEDLKVREGSQDSDTHMADANATGSCAVM